VSDRTALIWLGSVFALFFVASYLSDRGRGTAATILFVLDFLCLISYSFVRHVPKPSLRDGERASLAGSRARQGAIFLALAILYVILGTSSTFSHHIGRLLILAAVLFSANVAVYVRYRNR
jgi:hypothetical protein